MSPTSPTASDMDYESLSDSSSPRPKQKKTSRKQEEQDRKRRRLIRKLEQKSQNDVSHQLLRQIMLERTEIRKATALKTSHLKDLTEDKAKLFQVLSAKNYDEKNPKMNADASALTSNRTLNSVENRLSDWQENWPGTVITGELIHFLAKGYHHEEQPGGFHVFMVQSRRDTRGDATSRDELLRSVL